MKLRSAALPAVGLGLLLLGLWTLEPAFGLWGRDFNLAGEASIGAYPTPTGAATSSAAIGARTGTPSPSSEIGVALVTGSPLVEASPQTPAGVPPRITPSPSPIATRTLPPTANPTSTASVTSMRTARATSTPTGTPAANACLPLPRLNLSPAGQRLRLTQLAKGALTLENRGDGPASELVLRVIVVKGLPRLRYLEFDGQRWQPRPEETEARFKLPDLATRGDLTITLAAELAPAGPGLLALQLSIDEDIELRLEVLRAGCSASEAGAVLASARVWLHPVELQPAPLKTVTPVTQSADSEGER